MIHDVKMGKDMVDNPLSELELAGTGEEGPNLRSEEDVMDHDVHTGNFIFSIFYKGGDPEKDMDRTLSGPFPHACVDFSTLDLCIICHFDNYRNIHIENILF
jgi:hypothetical protein